MRLKNGPENMIKEHSDEILYGAPSDIIFFEIHKFVSLYFIVVDQIKCDLAVVGRRKFKFSQGVQFKFG